MNNENKRVVQDRFKFFDDEESVKKDEKIEEIESKKDANNKEVEILNLFDDEISLVDVPEKVNVSEFKSEEDKINSDVDRFKIEDDETTEEVDEEENSEEVVQEESNDEKVVEEKQTEIKKAKEEVEEEKIEGKSHIAFGTRITIMIVLILAMFAGAGYAIYEALYHNSSDVVHYNEESNTTYKVCMKNSLDCRNEGISYETNLVKSIQAKFDYDISFLDNTDYNLAYHINTITKIYNRYDNKKVLYEKERTLVDKVDVSNENNKININREVEVNYDEFEQEVENYKGKYVEYADSSLEIVLYLDENIGTRKVSSVTVPLNTQAFTIKKYDVSNKNKAVHVEEKEWNTYNTICAAIASVLIIISLILVYKVTNLILRVTNNRNLYQKRLMQILSEYDRIIVVARDGYESNVEKEIIKVKTFDELLDVKDKLSKPIIYSKVNDVKSEFIVEDDDKLYKYVMKEIN